MYRTRNSAAAATGYDDGNYDERLRQLQARLRDSEARRVELERKMFECSKFDSCKTKLKHKELKKYLDEICERQKKSLLRNQDLLEGFDCVEACIRKFASSSESLQKLKGEYERKNKIRLDLERNPVLGSDESGHTKDKMLPEGRQAGINTRTAMSRGLYHTATIFMGRQMSAVSSIEDFSALQKSSKLTKDFSISDLHSHRQPSQSSYVTDSCVVQTNSDLQCSNKSDKIDGKTYLLMGKEMPVTSNVSPENGKTYCLTAESKTNNCSSNFVESKLSPECNSLLHGRLGPENRTIDFKSDSSCKSLEEILTHEHSVQNEQGSKRAILVGRPELLVSGNEHSRAKFPVLEDRLPVDKDALEEEDESLSGTKDLSVSSNEEEEELNPLRVQQSLQKIECNMSLKSVNIMCKEELPCLKTSHGISSNPATRECLSFEGFSHVLTFIEESIARTPPDCRLLYQNKFVTSAELETLTSLCNEIGSLEQEDLEACEALVLHQLQRLLQSTMSECLLPENIGTLDEKPVRTEQKTYFLAIWKRLSKHVLFLHEHGVSLEQEVKSMLDTLLVLKKQEQRDLATPLLNENFPENCESRSLVCSDKISYNLQPNNNTRQGKDAQRLSGNSEKDEEVTNWCEDESKQESLVEKIPIAGLNVKSSGFKEQKSSGKSSESSFSSPERRSPLSRNESRKGMVPTIKSKAFWGDSDDSTSDIEAALRPQVSCSQDDEFDDFYD